ncbi:MAG: hypothetical protein ACYTG4_05015, partial [Planctomycetota bacterium]
TNRIRNNETAAIASLKALHKAQDLIREAAIVDADEDGRGEYAFLLELSGEKNPRSFVPGRGTSGRRRAPATLPQFYLKVRADGEARLTGYAYRLWLPGEADIEAGRRGGDGAGERLEGDRLVPTISVDARMAASHWCAYAWPERLKGPMPAASGTRTFFINQMGWVTSTDGGYTSEVNEGETPRRPAAGAAFSSPGPLGTITGSPARGTMGRDGSIWKDVR